MSRKRGLVAFIVPTLEAHLYARFNFGVCKLPVSIADPGHVPGTGIVRFRGAVSPDPLFNPAPRPEQLVRLFTLPVGMRPVEIRWLTCQIANYLGMFGSKPTLCVVRPNGVVEVKTEFPLSVDGAVFFDGVSFIAEVAAPRRPLVKKRSLKGGRRKTR